MFFRLLFVSRFNPCCSISPLQLCKYICVGCKAEFHLFPPFFSPLFFFRVDLRNKGMSEEDEFVPPGLNEQKEDSTEKVPGYDFTVAQLKVSLFLFLFFLDLPFSFLFVCHHHTTTQQQNAETVLESLLQNVEKAATDTQLKKLRQTLFNVSRKLEKVIPLPFFFSISVFLVFSYTLSPSPLLPFFPSSLLPFSSSSLLLFFSQSHYQGMDSDSFSRFMQQKEKAKQEKNQKTALKALDKQLMNATLLRNQRIQQLSALCEPRGLCCCCVLLFDCSVIFRFFVLLRHHHHLLLLSVVVAL
jgi:hypothetical protein